MKATLHHVTTRWSLYRMRKVCHWCLVREATHYFLLSHVSMEHDYRYSLGSTVDVAYGNVDQVNPRDYMMSLPWGLTFAAVYSTNNGDHSQYICFGWPLHRSVLFLEHDDLLPAVWMGCNGTIQSWRSSFKSVIHLIMDRLTFTWSPCIYDSIVSLPNLLEYIITYPYDLVFSLIHLYMDSITVWLRYGQGLMTICFYS